MSFAIQACKYGKQKFNYADHIHENYTHTFSKLEDISIQVTNNKTKITQILEKVHIKKYDSNNIFINKQVKFNND